MVNVNATTPGSSIAKTPAAKDKECPYCHQAFTSSSLGRHLDLYIKDKNAKPPDNLHNVDEIRQIRGNVTRRQARTFSGKRDGSTPSSSKPTPLRDQRSPSIQGVTPNNHQSQQANGGPIRTYLNRPNWQSTGVINDLPSITDNVPPSRVDSQFRRTMVKGEIHHKRSALEERDRAQAAEMALKEVLDSVKAANFRAHPPSPFDSNFFSLTFPELCLQCLSAPQSLLSAATRPARETWSTDTPNHVSYEMLQDEVEGKLVSWHRLRQSHVIPTYDTQANDRHFTEEQDAELMADVELYKTHLTSTYETWKAMPDTNKQEVWLHECAKAFAREQEKHKDTKRRLDVAEQKIQLLQAQLTQQYPPATAEMYAPSLLPITRETADELPSPSTFNYDGLLSKWKTRIQSFRSIQHPLPAPSAWMTTTPTSDLNDNTNGNGAPHQTNGASHNHHHHNNNHRHPSPSYPQPPTNGANGQHHHHQPLHHLEDEDEDLADAPGDEDDLGQQQQTNGIDRRILDPSLTGAVGVGVGADADGEGQAGRMLLGLREYVKAAGGAAGNGDVEVGKG